MLPKTSFSISLPSSSSSCLDLIQLGSSLFTPRCTVSGSVEGSRGWSDGPPAGSVVDTKRTPERGFTRIRPPPPSLELCGGAGHPGAARAQRTAARDNCHEAWIPPPATTATKPGSGTPPPHPPPPAPTSLRRAYASQRERGTNGKVSPAVCRRFSAAERTMQATMRNLALAAFLACVAAARGQGT